MRTSLTVLIAMFAVLIAAAPQPIEQGNDAAIPLAKRSWLTIRNKDETVNFDALNNHVASVSSKILHGYDMFEKSTGRKHPSAINVIAKRGNIVPLGYYNEEYFGTIFVGTPNFAFNVVIDTSSADLFISSTLCDTTCHGHWPWDPTLSSTATDLSKPFDIDYGNGIAANGEQFTDNIIIANMAAAQTFGAAAHYSSVLQDPGFQADGVIGMAYATISNLDNASPLLQTLVSQEKVSEPVFSLKLADSGGELYLGGSNIAQYIGDFSYVPVTTQGFFEFTVDSIGAYRRPVLQNVDCAIDTSSALIIGHPDEVAKLHTALSGIPAPSSYGQGYYTFHCDTFPTIYLTIGGSPFQIPPSDLNLGPISPNSTDCVSAIVAQDIGSAWILGLVFLRNVYTTFDLGGNRVGFALLYQ